MQKTKLNNKLNIIILLGVLFTSIRIFTGAFSVAYIINRGIDVTSLSLVKSYQLVLITILDIWAGYLSEKIGYYKTIALSAVFALFHLSTMFLLSNIGLLFLAETFNGISLVLFSGAFEVLLKRYSIIEDKSQPLSKILGRFSEIQFISIIITSFGGSIFASYFGENNAWLMASALMFLLCILYGIFTPTFVSENNVERQISEIKFKVNKMDFINAWNDVVLLKKYVVPVVFVLPLYEYLLIFWQPILFEDLNASKIQFGVAFVIIMLAQAIAGNLIKKELNYKKIILASIIMISISLMLTTIVYFTQVINFISIVLLFFVLKMLSIVIMSKILESFKGEFQATSYSIITTISRIVTIGVLNLGSRIFDKLGANIILIIITILVIFPIFYTRKIGENMNG